MTEPSMPSRSYHRPPNWVLILLGLCLALLLIQPTVLSLTGFEPIGDSSIVATRSSEIVTVNTPTLGMVTSLEVQDRPNPNHPGPAFFYLNAPFVWLFGSDIGLLLAPTAMAATCAACAASCGWRTRSTSLTLACFASILLAAPSIGVPIAWPSNSIAASLPFLTCVFLGWRCRVGDDAAAVAFLMFGSLAIQFHVQFALPILALGLWSLSGLLKAKASIRDALWLTASRRIGLVLVCVLWAGPIGNLLMNGGGNAALLARAVATSEGTTQGLSGIVRGSLILLDPRPSLDWTSKYSGGTPLGILLASGLFLGAVAVAAYRHKIEPSWTLLTTGWLVAGAAAFNTALLPAQIHDPSHLLMLSAATAFLWFASAVSAWQLWRPKRRRPSSRRTRSVAALGLVMSSLLASFPFFASWLPDQNVREHLDLAASKTAAIMGQKRWLVFPRNGRRAQSAIYGLIQRLDNMNRQVLVEPGIVPLWGSRRNLLHFDGEVAGSLILMEANSPMIGPDLEVVAEITPSDWSESNAELTSPDSSWG